MTGAISRFRLSEATIRNSYSAVVIYAKLQP
jgi:hypothetical protein